MDEIQKTIANIEKEMVKLFNEEKVDEILKMFSRDFVGFSSTKHERITSRAQLKKTFLYYLKEGKKVSYSIKNINVKILGETALATFYWKVEIPKKKKVQTIEGRASHVFLMIEDTWVIVHEHFSRAH